MPVYRRPRAPFSDPPRALEEVVPGRAVLTELARGFLLVNDSDPQRAARFARRFLQEQTGGRSSTEGSRAPNRWPPATSSEFHVPEL
jgi:hypothetical protein